MPALKDRALCQKLKCSWTELQELPEELVEVWEALIEGEEFAAREAAALG